MHPAHDPGAALFALALLASATIILIMVMLKDRRATTRAPAPRHRPL